MPSYLESFFLIDTGLHSASLQWLVASYPLVSSLSLEYTLPLAQIFHFPSSFLVILHLFILWRESPWYWLLLWLLLLVGCQQCRSALLFMLLFLRFMVTWTCLLLLFPGWGFSLVPNTAFLLPNWNSLPDTSWKAGLSGPDFAKFLVSFSHLSSLSCLSEEGWPVPLYIMRLFKGGFT